MNSRTKRIEITWIQEALTFPRWLKSKIWGPTRFRKRVVSKSKYKSFVKLIWCSICLENLLTKSIRRTKKALENRLILITGLLNRQLDLFTRTMKPTRGTHFSKNSPRAPQRRGQAWPKCRSRGRKTVSWECVRGAWERSLTDAITAPSATNASWKWTITVLGSQTASAFTTTSTSSTCCSTPHSRATL